MKNSTFEAKDSDFTAWVEHKYSEEGMREVVWLGDSDDNQKIALTFDDMYYLCEWFLKQKQKDK